MPSWITGRTTSPRTARGEASLSSYAEAHDPALELSVNWAPHYASLGAHRPEMKQQI